VQAQILKLLGICRRAWHGNHTITHDLCTRKIADRVHHEDGQDCGQGPVEPVHGAAAPYTRAPLAAGPSASPRRLTGCAQMMETRDLKVWFPIKRGFCADGGAHQGSRRRSIELRKGETLGVVGESGSGKTTLGFAILR
jgi:microcin C transport system ATP-binding protein